MIAQGIEAGGHRGSFDADSDYDFSSNAPTTLELVERLRGLTSLPIVAAGGIMTGVDAAHALNAGANAVQLGSAFLLCPESGANADYRDQIRAARGSSTAVTRAISDAQRGALVTRRQLWATKEKQDVPPYPLPMIYSNSSTRSRLNNRDRASRYRHAARELSASDLAEELIEELAAKITLALSNEFSH